MPRFTINSNSHLVLFGCEEGRRRTLTMLCLFFSLVVMVSVVMAFVSADSISIDFTFKQSNNIPSFEDFLVGQQKIIDNTGQVDSLSKLNPINFYERYFTTAPFNEAFSEYQWIYDDKQRDLVVKSLDKLATPLLPGASSAEIATRLLHANHIREKFPFASEPHKDLVVAFAGRGSKGKTTDLESIIGHDVCYSEPGESTRLIIEYHVYYIGENEAPRFYFGTNNDSDSSKAATESEIKQKVVAANKALDSIDASRPPLQIAVYTNKASMYGLLIDTPGTRSTGTGSTDSTVANDDAVYEMIANVLRSSHPQSTIIVNEAIAKVHGSSLPSFPGFAASMESKGLLKEFLQHTIIVVNQANLLTNNGQWTLQDTEETAFAASTEDILNSIKDYCQKANMKPLVPIFIGQKMEGGQDSHPAPWEAAFDRELQRIIQPRIQAANLLSRVNLGGMAELRTALSKKLTSAANPIITGAINTVKSFIKGSQKPATIDYFPPVLTALQDAEKRLFRMIHTYMTSFDEETATTGQYRVYINRDDEPQLGDYLAELFSSGKLQRSKYQIDGEIVTATNIHDLLSRALAKLDPGDDLVKPQLYRNGANEVRLTAIYICSFLLSMEMVEFDEVRYESQVLQVGRSLASSSIQKGVENIVLDDVRAVYNSLAKYLRDSLMWLFPKIIDVALILDKHFNPNFHPNVLDKDDSMLVFRSKCHDALESWLKSVLIILNNNINKANADRPEHGPAMSASSIDLLGDFFNPLGLEVTIKSKDRDKINRAIMRTQFDNPEDISHKLTAPADRLSYAKGMIETFLKNLMVEINRISEREAVPFSSKQTSQEVVFQKILDSYLYHDVAYPHLNFVTETESINAVSALGPSQYPFTIHSLNHTDHVTRLERLYHWEDPKTIVPKQQSPRNILFQEIEKLKKEKAAVYTDTD